MITEESAPPETNQLQESLPVQPSASDPLMDMIAQDRDDATPGESQFVQAVLHVMTWATFALALSAVFLLIRAILR